MKKKMLIIIVLLTIIFPSIALAEGYTKLDVKAVFVTSADTSIVDKVYVQFKTISGTIVETKKVYLLRNEGFKKTIDYASPIEDVQFVYGYTMYNDKPDKFGFLPIKGTRSVKSEGVLELMLSIDFDNLNFDGKKYRANSDLSNEDIENIVSGQVKPSTVTNDDEDYNMSPDQLYPEATAPEVDDELNIIEDKTPIVIDDPDSKKDDKKVERVEETKTYKILIIIAIVIVGFVALAAIVLFVKNNQANKRV